MARKAKPVILKEDQLIQLTSIAQNPLIPSDVRNRAKAILLLKDGRLVNDVAAECGVTKYAIMEWRDKFLDLGMDSLSNKDRTGRGGKDGAEKQEQMRAYLLKCSDDELDQMTAAKLVSMFDVSAYSANKALKDLDIVGTRRRQWDVGYTESPIAKQIDVLCLYLASDIALSVVATARNNTLPLMRGAVRTTNKAVADAIVGISSGEDTPTVLDLIRVSASYLGKREASHRFMTVNTLLQETVLKLPNPERNEYRVYYYAKQPIQATALGMLSEKTEVHMLPFESMKDWANAVSAVFDLMADRAVKPNGGDDFRDAMTSFVSLSAQKDEPFIWMKRLVGSELRSARTGGASDDNTNQVLTTVYTLSNGKGDFTCSFKRNVDIPEIGNFDLTTNQFYLDFDQLERAVIQSRGDTLKFAEQYLAACAASQEKAGTVLTERAVDGEIGRVAASVGGELLESLHGSEALYSIALTRMAADHVQKMSYADTTDFINRYTHREETGSLKIAVTTLSDRIKRFAAGIVEHIEGWTRDTLVKFGFNPSKGSLKAGSSLSREITDPSPYQGSGVDVQSQRKRIEEYVAWYNETHEGDLAIKHMEFLDDIELAGSRFVYVSPDDVEAKHQKSKRDNKKTGAIGEKGGEKVQTTNVHIEADNSWYAITGHNMPSALKTTLAFLLENHLLENRQLIIFSDGARSIKNWSCTLFSFCHVKVVIDWIHLQKKCNEYFSMALCGGTRNKDARGQIKREFFGRLWVGNLQEARDYLKTIDSKIIKNGRKLHEMSEYLERKKYGITCYAVRRHLELRNSSNRVEKLNDNDFSRRQKHNGMSWSHSGSHELATMTSLFVNGEMDNWLREGTVSFKLHPYVKDVH